MKAKFYAANPNGIPMTLVLTQPLEDWVKVREAIDKSGEPTHYGALAPIVSAIYDMTRQAEKTFTPEGGET